MLMAHIPKLITSLGRITIGKLRKWSIRNMVRAASLCNWRM
jgi:hypothetical protein